MMTGMINSVSLCNFECSSELKLFICRKILLSYFLLSDEAVVSEHYSLHDHAQFCNSFLLRIKSSISLLTYNGYCVTLKYNVYCRLNSKTLFTPRGCHINCGYLRCKVSEMNVSLLCCGYRVLYPGCCGIGCSQQQGITQGFTECLIGDLNLDKNLPTLSRYNPG